MGAIRALIYCIADNPVGLRLLQRIWGRLGAERVRFVVGEDGFMFDPCPTISLPRIGFIGDVASRNDMDSLGIAKNKENGHMVLSRHNRPFYVGFVHKLIHLMHCLEGRRTGIGDHQLNHDDFGGDTLWGCDDDLHVIWGVYSVKGNSTEYDNVSELTFRIADNIPVRVFYEHGDMDFDRCVGNRLDGNQFKVKRIEQDVNIYNGSTFGSGFSFGGHIGEIMPVEEDDVLGEDSVGDTVNWESVKVNAYERLREVLQNVGIDHFVLCEPV